MKSYNNFIFDLDGTLLNTVADLSNSLNNTLKIYNYPLKSLNEVQSYLGNGIAKLIELSIPLGKNNKDFDNIYNDFFKYYGSHLTDYTTVYDNIIEVLRILKQNNCSVAVVSNKADKFVKHLCNHFFKNYIDMALGEQNNLKRKPHKDMVEYAMNHLNSSYENSVYIGDSEVDLLTAQNSSLPCISVSWGFRSKQFLINQGAKIIIDEPMQLIEFAKK